MQPHNNYPYALQHYHQMLGARRQWMNLVIPYINTEQQLSPSSSNGGHEMSPSKHLVNTAAPEPNPPKASNFSIAAILGL